MVTSFETLRKRRRMAGLIGLSGSLLVGVPATYLLYGVLFNATTFSFCCAGTALALLLGEKARRISTADELAWLKIKRASKPIGIAESDNQR